MARRGHFPPIVFQGETFSRGWPEEKEKGLNQEEKGFEREEQWKEVKE